MDIDFTNRMNRMGTEANLIKINELNDSFNKDELTIDEMTLALLDINYDDIRNGLILSSGELVSFLKSYSEYKDINKVIYLSYMINTYYNNVLDIEIDKALEEENYEFAAVLNDAKKITDLPLIKE